MLNGLIVGLTAIFILRLLYLQVIDDSAKLAADNNAVRATTIYPARGNIFDRYGDVLVFNKAAYDLMVVPIKTKAFDTTDLCVTLDLDRDFLRSQLKKARQYSRHLPTVVVDQLSPVDFARLQEKLFRFPGFFIRPRTMRAYKYPAGGHVLGYVSEVNEKDMERDPYYTRGDYIGTTGLEKQYEKLLRGQKGVKKILVDALGREQGSFRNGIMDIEPEPGIDLYSTLDGKLQQYAEKLMHGKIGSIVAIEPSTGEVLLMVSGPTYNPGDLIGRSRGKTFSKLLLDSLRPLNNRAMSGTYPPGSTFKPMQALIGLQTGVLNENVYFSCQGPGSSPIKCTHNHQTPLSVVNAIAQSCNPFFWQTYRQVLEGPGSGGVRKGYQTWYDDIRSLGFGQKLGIDMPNEKSGSIPSVQLYDKWYNNRWNALTVRSNAIGQGEVLVTPLQLANEVAVVANRGYYVTPHLVRAVRSDTAQLPEYVKHVSKIEGRHFGLVVQGMAEVYVSGTARRYANKTFTIGGKTGTVQNSGKDHSLFVGFAPVDTPKIAISVVVENAGFGSTWAAPIATLLMEKYLLDTIPKEHLLIEESIINGNLTGEKED